MKSNKVTLAKNASNQVLEYLNHHRCGKDGNLHEHIYNLTVYDSEGVEDHIDSCYGYEYTCMNLLALLSNPKISSLLPAITQTRVGKDLMKLAEFFKDLRDVESVAAIEFQKVDQFSSYYSEEEIDEIGNDYRKKNDSWLKTA